MEDKNGNIIYDMTSSTAKPALNYLESDGSLEAGERIGYITLKKYQQMKEDIEYLVKLLDDDDQVYFKSVKEIADRYGIKYGL